MKKENKGQKEDSSQKRAGKIGTLKKERQVLLIINNIEVCKNLEHIIHDKFGFEVETTRIGKEALKRIETLPWQYDVAVIYVDLKEKGSGLELIKEIKKNYLEIEVIYIIKSEKRDTAEAWEEGAFNCFITPINYDGIAYAVRFAREQTQFRRERRMLEKLQDLSAAISSATELQDIQNLTCQAAVEILGVDHSGLVLFEKDLTKGKVIAEYPSGKFINAVIPVKGIPAEEDLVYKKEIINVPDLSSYSRFGGVQETLTDLKIRSILIVPVILNERVIASISLDMITKNRIFYSDEIELCEKFANQVAVAIGKARYLKELLVLNKIALHCRATLPVDRRINDSEIKEEIKNMLETVRKHAGTLLDVRNFYIALYDEKKDDYLFIYHKDEKDVIQKIPKAKRRRGMTDYVRRGQKPIRANAEKIKKFVNDGVIKLAGEIPQIYLGVPLIARGKAFGVMAVQNYHNENAYDEHDFTVLQTIASQAAIAIDNAELFRDAHRRIYDLEVVDSIAHTISIKLNTEDIFETMVTQIVDKLKCNHCSIFLLERKKGEERLVPQKTHGLYSDRIMSRTFSLDEGLAGWVFQHGESIITPDARNDPHYSPARQRENLPRSMLVVPIKVGIRTIGVISADQDRIDWFSESDRQLVDTLSQHAGIAIERASGLNLLQEISLQVNRLKDENEILQRIVTGAIELTNTASGTIYLISDDNRSVIKSYPYPPHLDHPPPRMNKKDGITRQVIKTGKMIIIPDVYKDKRINQKLLKKDLRTMLAVPLKIEGKVVGVLFLSSKELRSFTETECSLIETLASQAAIAIHNSRLYQESQRRFSEIEVLYETSQEIVGESMNIESVFDKILKMAVELSNGDSAQVLFRDTATDELKVVFTQKLDILKDVKLRPGEGMASEVVRTGEPIFSNDYYNSQYKAEIFDHPDYQDLFKALAEVPLKWHGEVIGVLAISSKNFFTKESMRLLERFAGPAAIAIAIAREISFRQTLLNNSPDAIVAIDKKGTIKEFNKATERILGYSMYEVLNSSVVELWGGLEEARRINRLLHESKNGTVSDIEVFVKSKEGEKIPVLFSGSLLYAEGYGEDKEEIGSIGHLEDQRIVSLKGRVRKLFDVIEAINRNNELHEIITMILVSSMEFFEAEIGCIMLHDEGYLRIVESYGFPENFDYEIKIKIGESFIGKAVQEAGPKAISKFVNSDPYIPFSSEGKSFIIVPLKIEDRLIGVLYLESRIEDYFRAEDELLKILSAEVAVAINRAQLIEERENTMEKLFASAKAVAAGELATGFVHEVKNSLNTIAVNVSNIGKRIQKEQNIKSKQEYIDKIETIVNEILRSSELSQQVQKFGRRFTAEKVNSYLNNVVRNAIALMESTIKKEKIKLDIKPDPALDRPKYTDEKKLKGNPICIDIGQIEQVIINLLLNAIEASPPRGRILVETALHTSTAGIKITDFGRGIKTEVKPNIFNPFFTTKKDGVGLGLYICKLIIEENHQGSIELITKPEKGTTFSVHLPRKAKK